jgi:hypothetical protein
VRAADATELVALEIFRQCESSRQPVTISMIERALHQLRAHRHDCRCGLCTAAAQASADAVYRVAMMWQRGRWPCRCALCGETVANAKADRVYAKADRVYRTASIWQRSVNATRARAAR